MMVMMVMMMVVMMMMMIIVMMVIRRTYPLIKHFLLSRTRTTLHQRRHPRMLVGADFATKPTQVARHVIRQRVGRRRATFGRRAPTMCPVG
jgi:hypothetical protein